MRLDKIEIRKFSNVVGLAERPNNNFNDFYNLKLFLFDVLLNR